MRAGRRSRPWTGYVGRGGGAMRGNPFSFRLVLAAGIAGVAVLLGVWAVVERAWFDQAPPPPEVQRTLDALRGALGALLAIWVAVLVVQRVRGRAETVEAMF